MPQAPAARHTQLAPKLPDVFQQPPNSKGSGAEAQFEVYLYVLSLCGRSEVPEESRMLEQVRAATPVGRRMPPDGYRAGCCRASGGFGGGRNPTLVRNVSRCQVLHHPH